MGGGSWTSNTYEARTAAKRSAGYATSFSHHEDILSGKVARGVHDSVDPKKVAGDTSPNAGKVIREAFDNDDHPNSKPIAVVFDQTGSMGHVPQVLQQKLPKLHGLLQRKGYVEDPQLLYAAVGDSRPPGREAAPLQIGQFEADNRGDEQLENFYLEGNGGGGNHESYALAAYYLAYHTDLDSVKKRGEKGYLFFIGDERLYEVVNEDEVRHTMGDQAADDFRKRFEGDSVPTTVVFDKLKESFEVYFLFAAQGSYRAEQVFPADGKLGDYGWGDKAIGWEAVLPKDHLLVLEEADAVAETIGLTVGLLEGTVGLDEGIEDLKEVGSDLGSVKAAGKALATVGASVGGGGAVATVSGGDDLDLSGDSGVESL